MTTENPCSPLLRARLEFLGVARRGDAANVFLEISKLSGLSFHAEKHTEQISEEQSEDLDFVTPVSNASSSSHTFQQLGPNCNHDQPVTFSDSGDTCAGPSHLHLQNGCSIGVSDRSTDGIVKQVPYTFNSNTSPVFQTFDKLKIPYETEIYKPKQERLTVNSNIFYCKNLFLKDRKGQFFLVICHEDYNMDLKQLRKTLNGYRNFNFGTSDDMQTLLGTEPGGVTPLALSNQNAAGVKMVIHKSLMKEDASLMFHPMDSNLATKITLPSLLRYLKSCNHTVTFLK